MSFSLFLHCLLIKDDDLDFIVLDYTSFSENTINKNLVWAFIMNLVLNKKDRLVNEMSFKLSTQPRKHQSMMTEMEFNQAINEFFYLFDDKQTSLFYETSLRDTRTWSSNRDMNSVPMDKLSHIAAYYYLIQIIQELKFGVDEYIEKAREVRKDNGSGKTRSKSLCPVTSLPSFNKPIIGPFCLVFFSFQVD
jgi:hypothetical protein